MNHLRKTNVCFFIIKVYKPILPGPPMESMQQNIFQFIY